MFRSVVELQPNEQAFCFLWLERFLQRSRIVRVEVVHHHANAFRVRIELVHQLFHTMRPLHLCPSFGDLDMSPAGKGFKERSTAKLAM